MVVELLKIEVGSEYRCESGRSSDPADHREIPYRQQVITGSLITPGGYHDKKLRITMTLERSMDVIRHTRNCYFLCFYEGEFYSSPSSRLAEGQGEQGPSGNKSNVASYIAEDGPERKDSFLSRFQPPAN
jgi:hypothetical protein